MLSSTGTRSHTCKTPAHQFQRCIWGAIFCQKPPSCCTNTLQFPWLTLRPTHTAKQACSRRKCSLFPGPNPSRTSHFFDTASSCAQEKLLVGGVLGRLGPSGGCGSGSGCARQIGFQVCSSKSTSGHTAPLQWNNRHWHCKVAQKVSKATHPHPSLSLSSLFLSLSLALSLSLFLSRSLALSLSLSQSFHRCVSLSLSLPHSPSLDLSLSLFLSICLSSLSLLFLSLSLSLSGRLSLSLSLSLSLCVCLPVCLYLSSLSASPSALSISSTLLCMSSLLSPLPSFVSKISGLSLPPSLSLSLSLSLLSLSLSLSLSSSLFSVCVALLSLVSPLSVYCLSYVLLLDSLPRPTWLLSNPLRSLNLSSCTHTQTQIHTHTHTRSLSLLSRLSSLFSLSLSGSRPRLSSAHPRRVSFCSLASVSLSPLPYISLRLHFPLSFVLPALLSHFASLLLPFLSPALKVAVLS